VSPLCTHHAKVKVTHLVLLWCTQTPAFIGKPLNALNPQSFSVLLAVHHFVKKLAVAKMLRQKKTITLFNS
jgi:hypothetical protein